MGLAPSPFEGPRCPLQPWVVAVGPTIQTKKKLAGEPPTAVRRQVRTVETLLGQGRAEEDRASMDEGLLLSPGPFKSHRGPPSVSCFSPASAAPPIDLNGEGGSIRMSLVAACPRGIRPLHGLQRSLRPPALPDSAPCPPPPQRLISTVSCFSPLPSRTVMPHCYQSDIQIFGLHTQKKTPHILV